MFHFRETLAWRFKGRLHRLWEAPGEICKLWRLLYWQDLSGNNKRIWMQCSILCQGRCPFKYFVPFLHSGTLMSLPKVLDPYRKGDVLCEGNLTNWDHFAYELSRYAYKLCKKPCTTLQVRMAYGIKLEMYDICNCCNGSTATEFFLCWKLWERRCMICEIRYLRIFNEIYSN